MNVTTNETWVAIGVGILPLVGLLLWWWNDIWYTLPVILRSSGGTKLPPGYMGIPHFGDMLTFIWYFKIICRPDGFIESRRRRYGDGGLYRTHLFGAPAIMTCTPSANKFVLQNQSNFIMASPFVELVGPTSLVSVEGAAHTRIRSFLITTVNRPDALRRIALVVQPRVTTALKSWAQKGKIKVFHEAKKVTFANMGKYFAGFEPGPLLDNMDKLFMGLMDGYRASPINFPGTALHHAIQCRKKLTEIFTQEMEKRKKSVDSEAKNDIMEGLMQIKDEEGKQLSDNEVLDNIVSLVLAGYVSTSVALTWAFYYLGKYPDVLRNLREEHIEMKKNLDGNFITYEDISSCKYTSKVVEEVLRLANISPFSLRIATKDTEYKGYIIPKGWKVMSCIRHIHIDPQHFEDPLCFNPDRWNVSPKPGTHFVFGGGPRVCPGNMLARLQLSVLLHHLVIGYSWELVNPNASVAYLPYPMPVDGVEVTINQI